MRQVPLKSPHTRSADLPLTESFYPLLLGRGKLAQHLHHYLHLIEYPHKHYDQSLREDLDTPELNRKLLATNVIWFLISDAAIEPMLKRIQNRIRELGADPANYTYVHSSAATTVSGMKTFHPLMTFGTELYSREQYEIMPFASFTGEIAETVEFPFANPHFEMPVEKRAFYHASAVMMSNLPILLWSKVAREFTTQVGDASVFSPILKQTLENFLSQGAKALSGPIARNDQATIQKNLRAIEGTDLYPIYQSFLKQENQS